MTLWEMNNYKPKMVVGTKYRKLADQTETANAWGDWDPTEFTVEDSAFGFIVMENGATVVLKSSWALNIADPCEVSNILCGDKGGVESIRGNVRVNTVKNGRMTIETPDFSTGGVAFYDGASSDPVDIEARMFINAVKNGTEPSTLPEQAAVVTRILEAIYESSETGKPVYFD